MAEVIKYGAIFDWELFEQLERGGQALAGPGALEGIIARCVDLKRQVVEDDERDKGRRQLLNFGHTFGHAIEKQSDFTITHGHGVAIGMAMMARACERAGLAPAQTAARIEACCRAHGLPAETDIPLETLCKHAMGDKKRAGSDITLIILRSIGQAALYPAATGRLLAFMEGSSK